MGMYTELHFNSKLKKDTPEKIIKEIKEQIEHTICCDSYYFDADTHNTIRKDEISNSYYLCVRTNIKNYERQLEDFVEFVTPYLNKFDGEFLGFIRHEEDEIPTLIYHPNKFVILKEENLCKTVD